MSLPIFPPFILVSLVVFACCLISAGIGILLTSAKFKKRKLLKTKIIIALSFVGIITLYFLFYMLSNLIGRNSVKAAWDKLKAAGIPTEIEQIVPKVSENPSDNAVYLYEAAGALIRNSNVPDKRFDLFCKADKETRKETKYVPPRYNRSGYDISSWKNEYKNKAVELSKNKDVQHALKLFSEASRKTYAVSMKNYIDPQAELKAMMPGLINYREFFRMISFVSDCYASEGKINDAYELILDGLKSMHQFQNEPLIISHLVYIACGWTDLTTLNSLVMRYGISSEKAQKIVEALNQLDFNQFMKKGLSGELVFFTRPVFENLMNGDMDEARSLCDSGYEGFADCIYLYPFIYQEYADFIEVWLKNYKLYDKPYWQIKSQLEKLKKGKVRFLFMKDTCSILFPIRVKTARMNSLISTTKIILALHIYKNKHGEFPEKLDSLTPEILKEIIVDPITGKVLDYKKTGKYFKLTGFYLGAR